MSTFKSLITILPHSQGELIRPLARGASPSVRTQASQEAVMGQHPCGFMCRLGGFVHECCRRVRVMEAASEQAESGVRSSERNQERLHDERVQSENS
jgi:hypothetical protein